MGLGQDHTRALLAFFFKAFKIEVGEYEYRFHHTRRWRFDHAWPAIKLALEIDGGQWAPGGGRHNSDADREKINMAGECGWIVLRYSTSQIKQIPSQVAEQIQRCIENRKA